ncbi:MAG: sulfotransferase family 2 domain-containing protein [Alphaproteobacteria bacterium]|jgi:hypothetical protein|nr:sulfotransferase family 2 domain-containing protein [Alphaproteobacteria bacterium]
MIVSFQKNFVFIRTRKTASSTIETVLRQSLDSEDLFVGKSTLRHPKGKDRARPQSNIETVAAHMKAEDIAKLVPDSFWSGSFKFTSERHPYEKAVSLAYYNFGKAQQSEGDFAEFLDMTVRRGNYRSFDHYTIDGKVVVNDFIRHETLESDLKRIADIIGVLVPDDLPQKRTAFRADRRPAHEILTPEQKQQVYQRCREEFELLGYAA